MCIAKLICVNPFSTEETLSHNTWEKSNFKLRYVRLCDLDISRRKMAKLFPNSVEPDHMSDLDLHCLLAVLLGYPNWNWLKPRFSTNATRLKPLHLIQKLSCWPFQMVLMQVCFLCSLSVWWNPVSWCSFVVFNTSSVPSKECSLIVGAFSGFLHIHFFELRLHNK